MQPTVYLLLISRKYLTKNLTLLEKSSKNLFPMQSRLKSESGREKYDRETHCPYPKKVGIAKLSKSEYSNL